MQDIILFVEANTTGTGVLALQCACNLGLLPVFLTSNPLRYEDLEQVSCSIILCDTNSVDALLQKILSLFPVECIRGITTTSEFYLETVAYLNVYLKKKSNSIVAIQACRDKAQTRALLTEAQLLQPAYSVVGNQSEIANAIARIRAPLVVKPLDDTGSSEVYLCQHDDEVAEHVQTIVQAKTNVRHQPARCLALIEEYVHGPEYSVEMFSWEGQTICIGITEKIIGDPPYFVELRHIFPAPLTQMEQAELCAEVTQALSVVGITCGATHTEVKMTTQGWVVIEINARLAGGMIPELIRYASGLDILEQHIKAVIQEEPDLHMRKEQEYAGIQFLLAPQAGILLSIDGVEAAQNLPGVKNIKVIAKPGKRIHPPKCAYDRLGYIIASTATYTETMVLLDKCEKKISIRSNGQRRQES